MRSLLGLLLTLAAVTGCDDAPSPEDCDPPPGADSFEVGTGETCFERVSAGASVPLIAGPQGGYHVWLAVGCADCGAEAHIRARVFAEDGTEMADLAIEQVVDLVGDAWPQHAGIQLGMPGGEFDVEAAPLPAGTKLRARVETIGADGLPLHASELDFVIGETVDWEPEGGGCSDCN